MAHLFFPGIDSGIACVVGRRRPCRVVPIVCVSRGGRNKAPRENDVLKTNVHLPQALIAGAIPATGREAAIPAARSRTVTDTTMRRIPTIAAVVFAFLLGALNPVKAATLTWNGNGDGSTWDTGNGTPSKNNWGGTAFNTGDNAIFAGTAHLGPTIGSTALTVGSV